MPNKLLTPNQTSPNQRCCPANAYPPWPPKIASESIFLSDLFVSSSDREMLLELDEEQTGIQMHVQVANSYVDFCGLSVHSTHSMTNGVAGFGFYPFWFPGCRII
jgi:hypothetical protein